VSLEQVSAVKMLFFSAGLSKSARYLGSISPTYLRAAFTQVAPKSIRIQSSCQYLFTLLGSTGAKAAHRMLMKLTPGPQEVPIFLTAFANGSAVNCGPQINRLTVLI